MRERGTSLRAAHLVLWSSPILLLVLVFTMTNPTTSTRKPPTARAGRGSSSSTTTSAVTTPTANAPAVRSTVTTAATTTVAPRPTFAAQSSTKTVVTEPATAPATATATTPYAGVRGSLIGRLGPIGAVVDLPLQGPGSWIVQATAKISATLTCDGPSQAVVGVVSIAGLTACDLRLTSWSATPMTWQVVPTP